MDGVTLVSGDRILLKNQAAPAENGIYTWAGAATLLVRTPDADSAADFPLGWFIYVREGTINGSTIFVYTQTAAVTLGSTSLTFSSLGALGPTGPTGPQGVPGPPGTLTVTGTPPYICIREQQNISISGGQFNSGSFQTRTLNTVFIDTAGLAALDRSTSRFTLLAGTYRCFIKCPAVSVDRHIARLQNITAGVTALGGTSEFQSSADISAGSSIISGIFGIRQPTTFEVQHRCQTTATKGFGFESGFAPEIYTVAEFWLESGPPPFLGLTFENPNVDKIAAKWLDALTSAVYLGQQSKTNLPFVTVGTTTSITNAVGSTAVYTFASPPAVTTNSAVTVTGATPAAYNVSAKIVTNVAGNTFSVDIGTSGVGNASVQGTAVSL